MSDDKVNPILPFCPRWSQVLQEKTRCLGFECCRYNPILDPDVRKSAGVGGFCIDYLNMLALDDLAVSLSTIAGVLETPSGEIYSEEILDRSRKEGVHGYE